MLAKHFPIFLQQVWSFGIVYNIIYSEIYFISEYMFFSLTSLIHYDLVQKMKLQGFRFISVLLQYSQSKVHSRITVYGLFTKWVWFIYFI